MNRRRVATVIGTALVASSLTIGRVEEAVANPDAVVVDANSRSARWTGNVGAPDPGHDPNGPCLTELGCAETVVDVQIEPAWWEGRVGAMQVTVAAVDDALADFDLHIYEWRPHGSHELLRSSAVKVSAGSERVALGRPSGRFVVRVATVAFLQPAQYTVDVEIGEGHTFASSVFGILEWTGTTDVRCEDLPDKTIYESLESESSPDPGQGMATRPRGVDVRSCTGFIRRPGAPPLFGNVTFPADATSPLPTLVLLHPWKGTSGAVRGTHANGCVDFRNGEPPLCIPQLHQNNALWFASRGYAVIGYSARGHGSSCGFDVDPVARDPACATGWTHVADRSAEVRDAQDLLSMAVDAGIADSDRLGASGESYGGGQTWLLATTVPDDWVTRRGTKLQLAAAAPNVAWTSLQNSLVPNGRATDGRGQDPERLEHPYGVLKKGWADELINKARTGKPVEACAYLTPLCTRAQVRMNDVDPSEHHSHMTGWQAFWEAGEPYDASPAAEEYARAFRGKSALNADAYVNALAEGRARPVPIFAVSGWTDTLFPAVESMQMYRRLEAVAGDYPMWLVLNDTGHGASGRPLDAADPARTMRDVEADLTAYDELTTSALHALLGNERRSDFFDHYLLGRGPDLRPRVQSLRTTCSGPVDTEGLWAPSWYELSDHRFTFTAKGEQTVVHEPAVAAANVVGDPLGVACGVADHTVGSARWERPLDVRMTLVGLPTVSADYELTGTDATVVAKVWDVSGQDGTKRLVTRGAYRLTGQHAASSGTLSFELFGNHWAFDAGDTLVLELALSDAPFLQPNQLASSVTFSDVQVTLPVSTHQKAR